MKLNIILFTLFTFFLTPTVQSDDNERIIEIRTIEVFPYGIKQGEKLSGIYYDLTNLIVSNAGYTFNNKIEPHPRILRGIKNGMIDLTIVLCKPGEDEYVDHIASLPSKKTIVIGLHGQSFNTLADLSGKTIAYLRGSRLNPQIANDKNIIKYHIKSYVLGIKMLISGRVDAVLGTVGSLKSAKGKLQKEQNTKVNFNVPLVVGSVTPCILMSNKSRSHLDIEKLKESFLELQANDMFNRLTSQYTKFPKK